jgi:metal-responsive CopG/Arc/MetJ family transcriptional regulator
MKALKTAISVPEEIFAEVEETAKRLGMNRSQLFTIAVTEFLVRHREDKVTERLNEVYSDESAEIDHVLAKMQFSRVSREDW